MKTILLLCATSFILTFSAKAQDKNYTETMDSLFINLNKTEITTGILYDRVFPFAGLDIFNLGFNTCCTYHLNLHNTVKKKYFFHFNKKIF